MFTSPKASEPFQIAAIFPPSSSTCWVVKESKDDAAVENHICDRRVQKKSPERCPGPAVPHEFFWSGTLADVCSLRPLLTLDDLELHLVPLRERFEPRACDCAEVDEYVRTAFSRDEAKSFCVVEPLHGAVDACHNSFLSPNGGLTVPLCESRSLSVKRPDLQTESFRLSSHRRRARDVTTKKRASFVHLFTRAAPVICVTCCVRPLRPRWQRTWQFARSFDNGESHATS